MPDQFRYLIATQELRDHFRTSEPSTIKYTGIFFAVFPLFIVSVKSIAYINYLIYLGMFIFILRELEDKNLALFFKAFYLCYPSLILYSSLGLRDILILFLMLMSLYYAIINPKLIFAIITLGAYL
ncbi:hypothetical protein [Aquella oligotrophica]|nr:hypothetical protein [Aquella oligotrophica]